MSETAYDHFRYQTHLRAETHPDRLAAVATLRDIAAAPVNRCRYLELGCGSGESLIALAYYLPQSTFHGIDLAASAIADGERTRAGLHLNNLLLEAKDLRGLDGVEPFHYIVAHGLYSWVPDEVRDALLRLCGQLLAPNGVAMVSYNALPGRYAHQYLRDLMLFHARDSQTPAARIAQSRAALDQLSQSPSLPDAWRPLLDRKIADLAEQPDWQLFHDDLGGATEPVYFRDFMSRASAHGLQYLGDADPPEMFDPRNLLSGLPGGEIELEQYLDFFKARQFRHTLLCRRELALTRPNFESCAHRFLYSALVRRLEDGQLQGLRRARINPHSEIEVQVSRALGETYPLPLAFADLLPYAGGESALRAILTSMVVTGFADFHVYHFPCQETVTACPQASRLARWQAARGSRVANACCRPVELDPIGRSLVQLLDGSRDHQAIARHLAQTPGAPPLAAVQEHLPSSLEWMAGAALLEA